MSNKPRIQEILEFTKGKDFEELIVIGKNDNGRFELRSSYSEVSEINMALDKIKSKLLTLHK